MARGRGRIASGLARAGVALVVVAAAASTSEACLDPTQMTLRVKSNVPCGDSKGVGITAGVPGAVERARPTTLTTTCSGGDFGTLVATPSGDKDSRAAFVIVQGIDRPASECAAAGFKGCIVARRILRYLPHTPLELPIAMHLACKDKECDEFSTCAKSGQCVSATIDDPASCPNGVCVPAGEVAEPALLGDGATNDGAANDGATNDGAANDGAANDGATDAPPTDVLHCPPTRCAAGQVCCWQRQSAAANGRCNPTTSCPLGVADLPMRCTRKTDCPVGQFCCGSDLSGTPSTSAFADTHCQSTADLSCKWVCYDDSDCPSGVAAAPTRCDKGTGYFTPPNELGVCVSGAVVTDAAAPL